MILLTLSSIDLALRKIIDGHGTVVIGCIDPSSRVRARTTLGVLAKLKDVVLPPIQNRPLTVTPADAASQQQTASDPPMAKGAAPSNMFFVDEHHRETYMSVSSLDPAIARSGYILT